MPGIVANYLASAFLETAERLDYVDMKRRIWNAGSSDDVERLRGLTG